MAFKMKYSKDGFPYKSALTHGDIVPHKHGENDFTEREKNKILKEEVIEEESSGTSPRPKEEVLKLPPVSLKKDDLIKKSDRKSDLAKTFEKGKSKRKTKSIQPDLDEPLYPGGDISKGDWSKMSKQEKIEYVTESKEDMG
tara:strand:+ start:1656 stop:2078 length:423 start_codon:yes stop_codon:yes gene_type:complete